MSKNVGIDISNYNIINHTKDYNFLLRIFHALDLCE